MVGGSEAAFDRARPILAKLGSTVTYVGGSGSGQVVIALNTARNCGAVLPATAAVEQMLSSLRQHGRGGEDHSALLTVVESLSAHEIGSKSG